MDDFQEFPKMARLMRPVILTEKLDGTNAQVCIGEDGSVRAGSRAQWITLDNDNFGFAAWVEEHRRELWALGPGRHFGEWWGRGINRNYGLTERRFSLFNVSRWALHGTEPRIIPTGDARVIKVQDVLPACCGLVPILAELTTFDSVMIEANLGALRQHGSAAAPGYMKPEGIVVYHVAGNVGFKRTLDRDDAPKTTLKGKS